MASCSAKGMAITPPEHLGEKIRRPGKGTLISDWEELNDGVFRGAHLKERPWRRKTSRGRPTASSCRKGRHCVVEPRKVAEEEGGVGRYAQLVVFKNGGRVSLTKKPALSLVRRKKKGGHQARRTLTKGSTRESSCSNHKCLSSKGEKIDSLRLNSRGDWTFLNLNKKGTRGR